MMDDDGQTFCILPPSVTSSSRNITRKNLLTLNQQHDENGRTLSTIAVNAYAEPEQRFEEKNYMLLAIFAATCAHGGILATSCLSLIKNVFIMKNNNPVACEFYVKKNTRT